MDQWLVVWHGTDEEGRSASGFRMSLVAEFALHEAIGDEPREMRIKTVGSKDVVCLRDVSMYKLVPFYGVEEMSNPFTGTPPQ